MVRVCVIFVTSILIVSSKPAFAQIFFQDVSDSAGGFAEGERWGASWGDFNGDLRPDLFVNDHRGDPASMYLNNGDGTFTDVIYAFDRDRVLLDDPKQDAHGATFVDFDNDGDQDLFATHSANKAGRLFVNNNGVFTDQASNSDLTEDGTARLPTWLDYNNDGFLDVFFITSNSIRTNVHDPDGSGGFIGDFDSVSASTLGISCSNGNYGQLVDINNDGQLDWLCGREGAFPHTAYSTNTIPFQNITSIMPKTANVIDSAVGDFDGNLQSDIFMVRGRMRPTEALKVGNKRVEAWISGKSDGKGFKFSAGNGELTITADAQYNDLLSRIKIGSGGFSPSSIPFTIDSNNTSTHGLNGSTSWGFYIGFDSASQQWTVEMRSSSSRRAYFQIDAENNVSDPVMIGLGAIDLPITNKLMMNNAGGFQEQAASRGITGLKQCASAVAGDFDNDMDEDIYIICRSGIGNIANIMYENQGDGTFAEVANAAGAAGPIGAGLVSGAGTAESVVTADYDLDGFLDLFVTNGMLMQPLRVGGPDKLYRNLGNNNHWVHIDLEGATTTTPNAGDNRDAIGAKVFVTAAGKTQVREQGHGYHRWSQNHKRIHFGLGPNTEFNIEVRWKNGLVDFFNNKSADQIYNIKQGAASGQGTMLPVTPGAVDYPPVPAAGDECGEPSYNANFDKAVFVWKDCSTNRWELKVMAGGSQTNLVYQGSLSTNSGDLTNIVPITLQNNDRLDVISPSLVEFTFNVSKASQDGFRFDAPGGATTQACLQLTQLPQGAAVLLGANTMYLGTSADLGNFQICSGPAPADPECGAPSYNKASETGLFLWKDCSITGSESWHIRITGGGNSPAVSYGGLLAASQSFTSVIPYSNEGNDVLDFTSDPTKINYLLKAANAGQDGFDFTFSTSTTVCFDPSVMPAGAIVELGSGRSAVTTSLELPTLGSCTPPSEPLECGQPGYSAGSDKNIYIWKDCAGSGDWHMRATGGGDPAKQTYIGSISSDLGFNGNVTPFSIEASDTLNITSTLVDFTLGMRNAGQDGFDFELPGTTNSCMNATTLPPGAQVLLGATESAVSLPYALQGSCP